MNRQIFTAVIVLLITTTCFTSCKKDNAKKDYTSLFKNTVWTGNFNYTGAAGQPVSVVFSDGGQLTWYELAGESTGTWKINNNTLSVTLAGNGFTADITDDNKFTNIKSVAGSKWVLADGALNNTTEESLDNTSWTAPNLVLNFKAGSKVDMLLGPTGATKYLDVPYVNKGKSIRFSPLTVYKWFIVNNSKTFYKGANSYTGDPAVYPFDLNKK
jgi:hypothetical protein